MEYLMLFEQFINEAKHTKMSKGNAQKLLTDYTFFGTLWTERISKQSLFDVRQYFYALMIMNGKGDSLDKIRDWYNDDDAIIDGPTNKQIYTINSNITVAESFAILYYGFEIDKVVPEFVEMVENLYKAEGKTKNEEANAKALKDALSKYKGKSFMSDIAKIEKEQQDERDRAESDKRSSNASEVEEKKNIIIETANDYCKITIQGNEEKRLQAKGVEINENFLRELLSRRVFQNVCVRCDLKDKMTYPEFLTIVRQAGVKLKGGKKYGFPELEFADEITE